MHSDFHDMVNSRMPDPQEVENIAVDEFSILKDHKYATIIRFLEPRQALYICEEKTEENVDPFFSIFSKEFYGGIESVRQA